MPQTILSKNEVALSIESSSIIKDSLGSPNMYIFNFKEDGYAVFSADERYSPILAVVKKGKFKKRAVSAGLISWFDWTMDQIYLTKSRKVLDWKNSQSEWSQTFKKVINNSPDLTGLIAPGDDDDDDDDDGGGGDDSPCGTSSFLQKGPYLLTAWGQWYGYNDLCPNLGCNPTGSNHNAPTGCVATAMAQVIRYWAVPTPFNYNYTGMPNTDNFSTGNNSEIHRLMKDAGDAADMDWSCSGSSASMEDAANALKNTFGYSSATYTEPYNQSLLISNLNYGYPVILAGYTTRKWFWPFYVYENGHAWVCDGYYTYTNNCYSSLFLSMNWGWEGNDNGWFAYNNWHTSNGNYQYKQGMIYNILPY
ncbi:MAG: hypothetical protein E6Q58_01535 [Niabella sp.]|nr:MAG: hypothetical protein E6Q58_01535 [Niabella sp.]